MSKNRTQNIMLRNEIRNTDLTETESLISLGANKYIEAATSDNTRKAYRQDIRHFINWGGMLPTTPDVIIKYLHFYAPSLNSRTLTRRLTAIKNWHVYQGFRNPLDNPLVSKTLKGIKNIHGKPREKASALTIEDLILMTNYLKSKDRLIDVRNNALLQIGFFGAFRASELVSLRLEDIKYEKEGVVILVARSKTDQEGGGQICTIPYGNEVLCPIKTLKEWIDKANIKSGCVFRRVAKNNIIQDNNISAQQVSIIIKEITENCNLSENKNYSSHSLRRGFATAASRNGARFKSIMKQGRWKSDRTVLGYIEEGKLFEENAAKTILKE